MWYVEVREVLDPGNGEPTGTFRLARVSEDQTEVHGLCTHSHDDLEEAWLCDAALEEARRWYP